MPVSIRAGALLALLALAGRAGAVHEEVIVYGEPLTPFGVESGLSPLAETNTALLLKRIAGANVNFNGSLAGIAQYRGMFGPRVNIDMDGMNVGNACSNNMDAPLHYLPRTFVEQVEVIRGIAPVSSGLDTIGGTVIARTRGAEFGDSDPFEFSGSVSGGAQSVDDGYSLSTDLRLASARHRLRAAASREDGSNRSFGSGTIRPTRYERTAFDLGYAHQAGGHEFSVDYRRNDTDDAGTPALPMDDIYSDADLLRGAYAGHLGDAHVEARLYWNGIDHLMSNYRMRRPVPGRRRDNVSEADTIGWHFRMALPFGDGEVRVGSDGNLFDYDANISSPDNPNFFVRHFNDVKRDRWGLFAEYELTDAGPWSVETGVRWTRVDMDAGQVDALPARMMPPVGMLRDAFNAADRSRHDDNIDAALVAVYRFDDALAVEAGVARKTRSPTHQERYLWLPLESTGGLSDGNLYIGDVDLDPETAWQFELGVEWHDGRLRLAPRAFYHRVDDYIQGVPATNPAAIMVATMNGDPTPLQYGNVDAELWGVDVEWAVPIAGGWQLQGIMSWVRGQRRDIDDDLFRIAPFNALVDLSYQRDRWSITLEGEVYAEQNKVSFTNDETASDGYGLLNLYGQYALPSTGLTLSAGVENLLDKTYLPHLNGINRVAESDVAVGARLPGDGINAFVQVGWQF